MYGDVNRILATGDTGFSFTSARAADEDIIIADIWTTAKAADITWRTLAALEGYIFASTSLAWGKELNSGTITISSGAGGALACGTADGAGSTILSDNEGAIAFGHVLSGADIYSGASGSIAGGYASGATSIQANYSGSIAIGIATTGDYLEGVLADGNGSVALGGNAQAQADRSVAIGTQCYAGDSDSVAMGVSAASTQGTFAYANGEFGEPGDAQSLKSVLRNVTTDATPTELFVNGSNARFSIINGSAMTFTIKVIVKEDNTSDTAGWIFEGVIKNYAGTTALVGTPSKSVIGKDAGAATWDVAITADDTNDALAVTVTGEAAHNLKWVAVVDAVECWVEIPN